jgi:hypothetical protein
MSSPQNNINDVSNKIDDSIDTFIEGVEKSQKGIFNKLLTVVKEVELNPQGEIKQTIRNLRLLARIRKTVENEILTESYKGRVNQFANQFPAIAKLNNGYFKTIEKAFDPNRELYNMVVDNSISLTRASLLESGIDENVIKPVTNILNDSVTSGASYTDMIDELRTTILGDEERLGNLMRYSKQITTDAMNQFNGTYNETIAKDLDLEWFYYSGGKRSTSRPFCKKYAGKYFHKKEVEDFGKGKDLDGSALCSPSSFCNGRAKGTNSSSIFKLRGGYNCKHIYKPTMEDAVPKYVINRNIDKGYYKTDIDLKDVKPKKKPKLQKQDLTKEVDALHEKKPIKTTSTFNAKTTQEATQQAIDADFARRVNYGKITPDILNRVNSTFNDLKKKYNIKKLILIDGDVKRKRYWAAASENAMYLNRTKFFSKAAMKKNYKASVTDYTKRWNESLKTVESNIKILEGEIKNQKELLVMSDSDLAKLGLTEGRVKQNIVFTDNQLSNQLRQKTKILETKKLFNRHNVVYEGKEYESVVIHELGHVLHGQKSKGLRYGNPNVEQRQLNSHLNRLFDKAKKSGDIGNISEYSMTNEREFFAETFTMYEFKDKNLPSYMKDYFDDYFEKTKDF